MEKKDGKLVLQPMSESQDMGILRAIANGLGVREQTERMFSYEQDDFADRIRGFISNLAVAAGEAGHLTVALTPGEARLAEMAIRANTSSEQRSNNGSFTHKGSAIANAALPEIATFVHRG